MNIYTCTSFTGFWPVGSAAVVVAAFPRDAAEILNKELRDRGLPGDAEEKDMMPLDTLNPNAVILLDGNY